MKILFQGDSLTDAGRSREETRPNVHLGNGYVNMIAGRLIAENPGAGYEIYNRGINGHRVADLYARWIEDALNPEYDVLSILCGINDVGFGLRLNCGSSAERFEMIYDLMLTEVRQTHPEAKLVMVEPFIFKMKYPDGPRGFDIYEGWETWSGEIRKRGAAARRLAQKHGALYVEMFDLFEQLSAGYGPETFSLDCIHLTPAGNAVLAGRWIEEVRKAGYID